jgi:drug/metabolite transporter (DMT)-like permease
VTPRAWAALATVYVVWGSTYLAIMVAIRTMPPLLMLSARFLVAGAILYVWAIRRGERRTDRPGARQWRAALVVGAGLLLFGNGGVALAEQRVDSGIVALLVAVMPLWMALLDRTLLGGRLSGPAVAGLALGFAGVALLAGPGGGHEVDPVGVAIVLGGSLAWAAASLYARDASLPSRPLVGAAMQMLAGGALLGIVGVARGELARVDLAAVSWESAAALAYLVVVGSLLGFTAYAWLIRAAPTTIVGTYAFVNPVIAVLLGWALLAEHVGPTTLFAGGAIIVAVALIVTAPARPRPRPKPLPAEPEEVATLAA